MEKDSTHVHLGYLCSFIFKYHQSYFTPQVTKRYLLKDGEWLYMSNHIELKIIVSDLSFFRLKTMCKKLEDINPFFPDWFFH